MAGYIQGMDFEARLPFLPSPRDLSLHVSSDEYMTLELPQGALANGDSNVKLKRGWTCYFTAQDEDGELHEGIETLLDGVSAGTMTEQMLLQVTRERCPDHLSFRNPDWRITPRRR